MSTGRRPDLPPSVATLVHLLQERGYRVRTNRYDREHFGNVLLVLEGRHTSVQITRDRGQWLVDAGPRRDHLYPVVVWRALLDGNDDDERSAHIDSVAMWLQSSIGRIEDLATRPEVARDDLEQTARRLAHP